MRITYYQTLCDCTVTKEGLIRSTRAEGRKLICAEHRCVISARFAHCICCGIAVYGEVNQYKIPALCSQCALTGGTVTPPVANVLPTFSDDAVMEILMTRADCIYRPLCFEVHFNAASLPCFGCEEFREKDIGDELSYHVSLKNLDDHISKVHQTSDDELLYTRGQEQWGIIFEKRERDLWSLNN